MKGTYSRSSSSLTWSRFTYQHNSVPPEKKQRISPSGRLPPAKVNPLQTLWEGGLDREGDGGHPSERLRGGGGSPNPPYQPLCVSADKRNYAIG